MDEATSPNELSGLAPMAPPHKSAPNRRPRANIVIDAIANEAPLPERPKAAATKPAPDTEAPLKASPPAPRRFGAPALAAMIVLGAGLAAGAMTLKEVAATRALAKANEALRVRVVALEQSKSTSLEQAKAAAERAAVARVKAGVAEMKSAAAAQSGTVAARLDKIEKTVATHYPTLDKPAANPDVTGSIHALPAPEPPLPPTLGAPAPVKTIERSHVPTGGYVLRDVRDGVAIVEGADGVREVSPGDLLPGAGRVRRLERRSGQWVLVTAEGVVDMNGY